MEITQMLIERKLDKQIVVYSYNGILLSTKRRELMIQSGCLSKMWCWAEEAKRRRGKGNLLGCANKYLDLGVWWLQGCVHIGYSSLDQILKIGTFVVCNCASEKLNTRKKHWQPVLVESKSHQLWFMISIQKHLKSGLPLIISCLYFDRMTW